MKNNVSPVLSPPELLLELKSLVGDAERLVADSFSGLSAQDCGTLRDRMETAKETLGRNCKNARRYVASRARDADQSIRANPYPSMAIVAGVSLITGALIGMAIERHRAS